MAAKALKYSSKSRDEIVDKVRKCVELAKILRPLNCLITETFDYALEKAETVPLEKPLAGVPLVVKDCFSTTGIRTTCGSKMLQNYVPLYNATVVEKLEAAGAIIIGKSNMDEFCMGSSSTDSFFGPVKNPWTYTCEDTPSISSDDDWLIAGGSSGGSAVSVATSISKIALGSDTGGSTRNPASFCGIVGLKPSYGLLSRHGLIPLVNSLDVPGLMANSVDEVGLMLDTVSGMDSRDSTSVERPPTSIFDGAEPNIKGLRIGIPNEYHVPGLSSEVWSLWNDAASRLEKEAGCEVVEVSLPHTQYSIVCYHVIGECDVASNMARYDGVEFGYRDPVEKRSVDALYAASRHEAFNEVVRRRILAGNFFLLKKNYEGYFVKAMKVRRLIAEDFQAVFSGPNAVDALLTPVTSTAAPFRSEFRADDDGYKRERMDDFFTQPANMAGVPAISLPLKLSAQGLPLGLQLISDRFQERKLLRIAKWLETSSQFPGFNIERLLRHFSRN